MQKPYGPGKEKECQRLLLESVMWREDSEDEWL